MGWNDSSSLQRNNFDFLRFALAGLVIFSHSFALLSGTDDTEPLMRLTKGQVCSGALAVDWFFVISGFLITQSWLRSRGTWDFFRKRIGRIYPGFIVAMAVCAWVVAPLATRHAADTMTKTQCYDFLIGSVTLRGHLYEHAFADNPVQAINGSLWSISYECWCYVGVAVLGLLSLLRRKQFVLSVFVVSVVVSAVFLVWQLRPGGKILGVIFGWPPLWARLLPYFLAGMVFYLFRDLIPHSNRLAAGAALALAAGVSVPHGLAVALPTAGTYLLFWIAFHPLIRLEQWASHGDFSYGIYLYAFPIQQLLIQQIPSLRPMMLFLLSLPLSVAAGFASWHIIEKRFVKRKRKHVDALPRPIPVAESLA